MNDYTLPPVPDHPESCIAEHWSPYELSAISAYGQACAEAVRVEITPRVVEIIKERDAALARIAELERQNAGLLDQHARDSKELRSLCDYRDRLRSEVEALRAGINRAEVSYGNMAYADDKRPNGDTDYTRGWGDCLRVIAARKGEGSEG